MKKIYILIVAIAVSFGAYAQRQAGSSISFKPLNINADKSTDTLYPASFLTAGCDSLELYGGYTSQGAYNGYICGTNGWGDLEKAQKFYITGSAQVTDVLAPVWTNTPSGSGSTSFKIYSVNATTKGPQAVLGTSATVPTNTIASTGLTAYHFSTPVSVTSMFFASFVIDQAPDTVAVLSSKEGCWSNDSLAWELWSGTDGWYSMYFSWGDLQIDLAIFPVVNTTASIENDYFIDGIKLNQNQPNPSTNATLIQYEIQNSASVSLEIYDITGRLVLSYDEGKQIAGKHNILVDSDKLMKGTYFYSLKADNHRLTKKMIITQ